MTHRTAFVIAVSRHARLLLTWPALVLLALAAAVGLALRTRRLGRRRSLLLATLPLVGFAMAEAVVLGVAHLVRRPYPTSLAGPSGLAGFAFPAAPAAALAAIALTTALVDGRAVGRGSARRWLVPATAGLVVGLAATEAVTASHWASDVAGGLVTGALVAVALAELTLPPAPGRRPSRPALGAGGVRRAPVVAVVGGGARARRAPGRRLLRDGAQGSRPCRLQRAQRRLAAGARVQRRGRSGRGVVVVAAPAVDDRVALRAAAAPDAPPVGAVRVGPRPPRSRRCTRDRRRWRRWSRRRSPAKASGRSRPPAAAVRRPSPSPGCAPTSPIAR